MLCQQGPSLRTDRPPAANSSGSDKRTDANGDGRSLVFHCAAFCQALSRHHRSEGDRAFPILRRIQGELDDLAMQTTRILNLSVWSPEGH